MKPDGKEFFSEVSLRMILETFGWDYSNLLKTVCVNQHGFDALVPFKADFYPQGWKLAQSKKAFIVCDGYRTVIKYKNRRYESPWDIYAEWGIKGFEDIEKWIYEEEKEWLIKKYNGEWVKTFSHLNKCPFRKSIRC
jgi:hypothetical protein